ncbi:hypothetical protein BUALT_Bualt02G0228800 [Buddleja alternifolia]|uniref:Peptidase A1 domain-containing protein n=1 Tax=Buddleja alternifolia TaxID=168488 RepID=A0AAV6Y9B0_9LAMI|nr:hypothetical protein BUALT_Bualt02G0228800 [Buddleja alternifolia]
MAKSLTLFSLYLFTNLVLILSDVLVGFDSLTITLIHPDSPESPFFQNNLSYEERIKRLVSQSNIRANYLAKTPSSFIVRPQIDVQFSNYNVANHVIKIGIGTFKSKPPYKEYYLDVDTGSSQIWLQCEGCTKCFKQTPKPFPKENSSSFRLLLSENKPLPYTMVYDDGDNTHGILARETFHLGSNKGVMTKIENLEFGCGLHNEMRFLDHKNNKIAGIMGMGWNDVSFVKQISFQSKGKFSYCLPIVVSGKNIPITYLRFGDDIIQPRNPKTTPLFRFGKRSPYHVELHGISISKTRLEIDRKVFVYSKYNYSGGGCITDSGSTYSSIIQPAFDVLKLEMEKYFSGYKNLKKLIKSDLGFDLCYERNKPEGLRNLPDVTFHLRGSQADFVMKAEAVFEVVRRRIFHVWSREYFCLAMFRNRRISIIGTHQQTNQRIVYDTMKKVLVFNQEDCSKNP